MDSPEEKEEKEEKDEKEKPPPTVLQNVLKQVFGKVRNVDETSSLTDYLFRNPTKQSAIKTMRESLFNYLSSQYQSVSSQDFIQAPVAIVREARQVPDAKNNLQKRFCYKLSVYGPNPNGAHTVEKKKATVQAVPLNTAPCTGYTGL